MADDSNVAFDPYHRWLGIPKQFRPPTHYQLLGLALGETDVEVIEEATIRQSTHLRSYQIGPHAQLCTKLLNEIGRARQVLVNPKTRAEYDRTLSGQTAPPVAPLMAAPVVESSSSVSADNPFALAQSEAPSPATSRKTPEGKPAKGRAVDRKTATSSSKGLIVGGAAGGAIVLVAIVAAIVAMSSSKPDVKHVPETVAAVKKLPTPVPPRPPAEPLPPSEPVAKVPVKQQPFEKRPAEKPLVEIVKPAETVSPKVETPKTEPPKKADPPKTEVAKIDVLKTEPKTEVPKMEVAKTDVPKTPPRPGDVNVKEAKRFKASPFTVTTLSAAADGKRLFSASGDGFVRIWDIATGKQISNFDTGSPIGNLQLSPDQKFVALYDFARLSVWTIDPPKKDFELGAPCAPCWTDDNRLVGLWLNNGVVGTYVYVAATRNNTMSALQHKWNRVDRVPPRVACLTFSNNVYLVDRGNDKFRPLRVRTPQSQYAAVVPGRGAVILTPSGKVLSKFSLVDDKVDATYTGLGGEPRCLAVSETGKFVAAGGDDKVMLVWDVETQRVVARLTHHNTSAVTAVAFVPGERQLVSGSVDGVIRLWNLP